MPVGMMCISYTHTHTHLYILIAAEQQHSQESQQLPDQVILGAGQMTQHTNHHIIWVQCCLHSLYELQLSAHTIMHILYELQLSAHIIIIMNT